ncbi:Rpn family recombination-promoting nuclease/putative transposase [Crateriforma conspicua]|uniref:Rpn family recombination-promoting nuclease/putative transposase n=1 Tax=Crateriforma conspicua TaxID=2527996 RepID=UPI00118C7A12|nr:Rpn family recombination-promoting nuclease/putative transposase [Crateriforma conspicua]QDV62526.1 PD-(D/E)XK nuclease family transposase [Crateriforma conspicua]
MSIGIDPLVDFAAKRVLGSPEHSSITLHFLNAVLGFADRIVDVTILNPINLKDFDVDKLSILDIKATDRVGRRYNIEVQTTRPLGLPKRLTYYAAKQLIEQLGEGDQYADLNPSISICLLDSVMFRYEPGLQHAFGLRTVGGLSLTNCLQVHVFELPKYAIPSDNQVIVDPVEQWLYFFRRAADCTPEELADRLPDPVFAEATGVLQMIARNPEERQHYDDRLKAERDEWARTEQAKIEGFAEGRREERLRTVKMLRDIVGESDPSDSDLAGLSLDQLGQLETTYQQRLRDRT